ncbi:MAG: sulfide-dependent adenosine diphosphate thiazole synthase [Acidobacteriota bacterium]
MSYETEISRTILTRFTEGFERCLQSHVIIVGAGPSGLVCAWKLAQRGFTVAILEKRLAPGGGLWGGGMGMGEVVMESEERPLLEELSVRYHSASRGELLVSHAAELASALVFRAVGAGAFLLNLTFLEDLVVKGGAVRGAVVNRTMVGESLPVDPLTLDARAVLDATGHEAVAAALLQRRGLLALSGRPQGEGPMDARAAEAFVVERTGEVYPGLYLAGMSVCSALGGPRMGPIFGGMLRSGARAADLITQALEASQKEERA